MLDQIDWLSFVGYGTTKVLVRMLCHCSLPLIAYGLYIGSTLLLSRVMMPEANEIL